MLAHIELRMLAGENQGRVPADAVEGLGNGRQLDCFGTCTDDERYVCGIQLPPYLGGEELAFAMNDSQGVEGRA